MDILGKTHHPCVCLLDGMKNPYNLIQYSFVNSLQNGSVEVNLTEWLLTTDNGNNNMTSDEQDTALDLAASLLVGKCIFLLLSQR